MIGVVALFSRPWLADAVLANFARQTVPATLVVVENGRARGAWGGRPGLVVQSAADRCSARNAGVAACRALGLPFFTFFEDDDHYGAGHLEHLSAHRELGDVVGQCRWQVETPSGARWLVCPNASGGAVEYTCGLIGGIHPAAMICRTDLALPWESLGLDAGEEIVWLTDMARAGRRLFGLTGFAHFVLRRSADPDHQHATADQAAELLGAVSLPALA